LPVIENAQWEAMAQNMFSGMSKTKAYEAAGFKPSSANAAQLAKKDVIKQRVAELHELRANKLMDIQKFKVPYVVDKIWQVIHSAHAAGDHKAAMQGLQLLMQAGGYLDSPTLYHEHLFKEQLTPAQVEDQRAAGKQDMVELGVSMFKAVSEIDKVLKMKTIEQ
jgi:hypothetical protein